MVQVGEVQVVLGFVVLGEGLVFRRRELAERRQVCVHVGDVEAMGLVEVAIPGGEESPGLDGGKTEKPRAAAAAAAVPWNDDSVLVVLQLEAEGVLLGVLRGRNAGTGLRLFNVFHELKVHVQCV